MKELTDKLSSIGSPISEEDQVVTLLGSLPSPFDSVVIALEARVDDLTLDFVQQQLLHQERKIKVQEVKAEVGQNSVLGEHRSGNLPNVGVVMKTHSEILSKTKKKSQHRAKIMEEEIESEAEGAFPVSVHNG